VRLLANRLDLLFEELRWWAVGGHRDCDHRTALGVPFAVPVAAVLRGRAPVAVRCACHLDAAGDQLDLAKLGPDVAAVGEPRMRRSTSPIPATASARPALIASTVGSTGIRFPEIARSESPVLFSKVLVTTNMPAEAISSGTRLGWGVSISERPTECSRSSERYSPWLWRGSTSIEAVPVMRTVLGSMAPTP